jgi:hypothetical protein
MLMTLSVLLSIMMMPLSFSKRWKGGSGNRRFYLNSRHAFLLPIASYQGQA